MKNQATNSAFYFVKDRKTDHVGGTEIPNEETTPVHCRLRYFDLRIGKYKSFPWGHFNGFMVQRQFSLHSLHAVCGKQC